MEFTERASQGWKDAYRKYVRSALWSTAPN